MNPDTIRALTPICLAVIGGLIGITVIVTQTGNSPNFAAGLGLAGTAITGAAGLAQPIKDSSDSVQVNKDSSGSVQSTQDGSKVT